MVFEKMSKATLKSLSFSLLFSVSGVLAVSAAIAQIQPGGLLQFGTTSLPSGQYMMTNINTGQSYYIFINAQGQLMAQDPRALQFNVQQLNIPAASVPGASNATTTTTAPNTTGPAQGGFGGMLKQGLNSFLQNQMNNSAAPQQ